MLVMRTPKSSTGSFGQLVGREQTISLYNPPLAMNPLGL
jgi:hypothetical protein